MQLSSMFIAALDSQLFNQGVDKAEQLLQRVIDWCTVAGGRIIAALIIFLVGRLVISVINKIVAKLLSKRNVDAGVQSFTKSLVNITLTILLLIAVVGKLGVETTSFAALLASAGVAVGLALSGNLQNFAGGVLILLLRPFKVGDFVEAQGVSGVVTDILIFHTIITTGDNRVVNVPNGALSSGVIINYSKEDLRRVDFTVSVEYGSDYAKVQKAIEGIIAADSRILKTPEPFIALSTLNASSVDFVVRVWGKNADYWGIYFDTNRAVYEEFNKAGIGFPFPQLTVHQAKG